MLVHVRTDECNERVSRRLQFKPGIGASGQSLTAYLLQVTVDRLNRMTIRAHFDGIHQPGVRTHGRPAHRDQAYPRLRQNAGRISRTIGGANNYSPLRPTAAPRRAVQTHPQSPPRAGGRGGGQHLNAHMNACHRRQTRCKRHPKNCSRLAAQHPSGVRPGAFRQCRARARR